MHLVKINTICYKAVCITGIIVFTITGVKILLDDLYILGMIVLVCAAGLSLLFLQKPALKTWIQVLGVGIVALITINNIDKIF